MRYSYEFKRKCVELYRNGQWAETPDGISTKRFHETVRMWAHLEEANGPGTLRHSSTCRSWTPEERYDLVVQVLDGRSYKKVAIDAGINSGTLYRWVRKFKTFGYNGLENIRKGRPPKEPEMTKINDDKERKLTESEYEELIRLREENAYIKAENAVIKKLVALREEKEAARLKAKKQRSSKNSAKKDTN